MCMGRDADTHIRVTTDTWKQLNSQKEPGESFDDVLQRLLAERDEEVDRGNLPTNPATVTAN